MTPALAPSHRSFVSPRRWRIASLFVAALLLGQAAASAPDANYRGGPLVSSIGPRASQPIVLAQRTEATVDITIDGKLDEAIWSTLPAYDHMTVTTPNRQTRGAFATHTFLVYTERGLYVGAWNEQPPETLVSRLSGRDAFDETDAFQIALDSSGNGLYGYWFRVKLGDSLSDGTLLPERNMRSNWDGPWRGKSQRVDDGWTVEMFLPWAMLNMPAHEGERPMKIMVARFLGQRAEVWSWPATPSTEPQFISIFQPVIVRGVSPRQEMSVFPYATYTNDLERGVDDRKMGLDVFWRPSSNFFLSAALNPDFGQVEADNVVVNLSAFETFFPEKRLFFLENQEVFNTGEFGFGTSTTLLHTRRLGSSVGSRRGHPDLSNVAVDDHDRSKPVDLTLATKAVAQSGRSRYGAMIAMEDDTSLARADGSGSFVAPGRDFAVMRYQYENTADGGRRAIGYLGTVADHPQRRAMTHAIDAHLNTPSGVWSSDLMLIASDIDQWGEEPERGFGGLFDLIYRPREGDQMTFHVASYDDEIDLNDTGFLSRNDYTTAFIEFWRRRQNLTRVRDTNSYLYNEVNVNNDGQITGAFMNFFSGVAFNNNHQLSADLYVNASSYDDRNSRGNGVFKVPSSIGFNAWWNSPPGKTWQANAGWGVSKQPFGGRQVDLNAFIHYNPIDRITVRLGVKYNQQDSWLLWQGGRRFATFRAEQWSPNLSLDTFFSARQQLRFSLQWVAIKAFEAERYEITGPDYLSPGDLDGPAAHFAISDVVLQARYRWQIAPLSDLFIVYNLAQHLRLRREQYPPSVRRPLRIVAPSCDAPASAAEIVVATDKQSVLEVCDPATIGRHGSARKPGEQVFGGPGRDVQARIDATRRAIAVEQVIPIRRQTERVG